MNARNRGVITGIILIALGLLFLAAQFLGDVGNAVVLILIGSGFVYGYFSRQQYGLLIPGGILLGTGRWRSAGTDTAAGQRPRHAGPGAGFCPYLRHRRPAKGHHILVAAGAGHRVDPDRASGRVAAVPDLVLQRVARLADPLWRCAAHPHPTRQRQRQSITQAHSHDPTITRGVFFCLSQLCPQANIH